MRSSADQLQLAQQQRLGGKSNEAREIAQKVVLREPYNVDALLLLAHLAHESGDWSAALEHFRKAAAIAPNNPGAVYGVAAALHALNRLDEAAQACRRLIQLVPDYANAHMNLGTLMSQMGMQEEALRNFGNAIALRPDDVYAHSNYLYALFFQLHIEPAQIYAEHVRWAHRHADHLGNSLPPPPNLRDPERPLRIGYVSADFREHSVAFFFEPILQGHDRDQFHITCYSATTHSDAITQRLQSRADTWREICKLNDEQSALLVRQDAIDILIDLSGHSANHRLLTFARRPAPVQMTYLGYPGTTGLRAIDYRITDSFADPPGTDGFHAEQLIRLPTCAWCYRPPESTPAIQDRSSNTLTFASFNRIAKISPTIIAAWSQILTALPDARLLIKSEGLHEPAAARRLLDLFARNHIPEQRLDIRGRVPSLRDHLDLYNQVDIALDTYPYNGTTTTCEALYMGVPVVTLAGPSHVSRVGASLLHQVDVNDLIAASIPEYIQKVIELAQNRARISELRHTLRQRMQPLLNSDRLTRALESAYREAWRAFCHHSSSINSA